MNDRPRRFYVATHPVGPSSTLALSSLGRDEARPYRHPPRSTSLPGHLRNNFSQIARWLKDGEQVVITMRKKVIARIIPEQSADRTLRMPDSLHCDESFEVNDEELCLHGFLVSLYLNEA